MVTVQMQTLPDMLRLGKKWDEWGGFLCFVRQVRRSVFTEMDPIVVVRIVRHEGSVAAWWSNNKTVDDVVAEVTAAFGADRVFVEK